MWSLLAPLLLGLLLAVGPGISLKCFQCSDLSSEGECRTGSLVEPDTECTPSTLEPSVCETSAAIDSSRTIHMFTRRCSTPARCNLLKHCYNATGVTTCGECCQTDLCNIHELQELSGTGVNKESVLSIGIGLAICKYFWSFYQN
ncbi:uncharacterized protein [Ptychodera flava]|uniref:uncharacterized protein n=1 Tax=Ptychodera flava TaxID=63121 RepID=UPI00396AB01C